jgi:hypothetical protein
LQAPEQAQLGAINPTLQGQIAVAEHAPVAADNALDRSLRSELSQAQIDAAAAEGSADRANRLNIANSGNANDIQTAQIMANSRMGATANRPVDSKKFTEWFMDQSVRNPRFQAAFAKAKQNNMAMEFQMEALDQYKAMFNTQQPPQE